MKEILQKCLIGCFCVAFAVNIVSGQTSLRIYDPNIRTVQLYPFSNTKYPALSPAVFSLNSMDPMILEFDDLTASYRQFHVKIVHCNQDWTSSILRDIDFLSDFNDFIINNFEVSQSTKVKYYHYGFQLPKQKISGNYMLEVYENSIEGPLILSHRFRVVDAQISVGAQANRPQDASLWRTHQQIDFEIDYGNYPLRDPRQELIVEIRQNLRDQTLKTNFRPSSVNLASRKLSYKLFSNENLFPAGNEFRILDIRSTYTNSRNVQNVKQGFQDQVFTVLQERRSNKTYLEAPDLNGRYLVETLEEPHPSVTADYIHVFFTANAQEVAPQQRFCVLGEFNGFNCSEFGEMEYDAATGVYGTEILLKQGIYDFQLGVVENGMVDFSFFEGDFTDTGNTYEIFVYHKPPAARSERLIGYTLISDSKRR